MVRVAAIFIIMLCGSILAQTLSFDINNPTTITSNLPLAKKIKAIDMDGDGDIDIVAGSSTTSTSEANVAWFRNNNNSFTKFSVDLDNAGLRTVDVGYINNDTKLDIAAATRLETPVKWYRNDDISTNSWTPFSAPGTTHLVNHDLTLVDLDQDGDLDIITGVASQPPVNQTGIVWYENDGSGSFTQHIINGPSLPLFRIIAVHADDLDGDGDIDILLCDSGDFNTLYQDVIFWLENDGAESFKTRIVAWPLGSDFDKISHPTDIFTGDIDNDNDLDIAVVTWGTGDDPGTSSTDSLHDVLWFENDGKPGNDTTKTWRRYDVGHDFWTPRTVALYDLDGDADLDILAVASDTDNSGSSTAFHGNGGYISYFVNDGNPKSYPWQRVDLITDFLFAYHAVAMDMDDDGDLDVVGSAQNLGEILWWENTVNDIEPNIATNTDYQLWNNKVRANFSSGPTGTEFIKAFYNANEVPNPNSLATGVNHVATHGFYTIKTDLSSYTVDLQFSYAGISEWSDITDENDLVMCYWNGSQWTAAGTVNPSVDSILVSDFTASSNQSVMWTLGSTTSDNPLPVQLLAFTAKSVREGVQLQWSTASEINNLGFEVWRSEQADSGYTRRGSYLTDENLQGAGNSNRTIKYQFIDTDVRENETYYYQLVDVDFNNSKTFHGPIEITYSAGSQLARTYRLQQNFPNPFNGVTSIPVYITGGEHSGNNSVRLAIYDITGQEVRSFNLSGIEPGIHLIEWDGKDQFRRTVASGIYLYSLFADGKMQTKRLQFIK